MQYILTLDLTFHFYLGMPDGRREQRRGDTFISPCNSYFKYMFKYNPQGWAVTGFTGGIVYKPSVPALVIMRRSGKWNRSPLLTSATRVAVC